MNDKIDKLIYTYLKQEISDTDKKILNRWVQSKSENRDYFKFKLKRYAEESNEQYFDFEPAFDRFLNERSKVIMIGTRRWIPYAAAILLLIGLSTFFIFNDLNTKSSTIVDGTKVQEKKIQDKITITLADGTKKYIDKNDLSNVTDNRGNIIANAASGALNFNTKEGDGFQEPKFNEIYIPYGQKFQLQLTDGSKVWLNSGSRLRFIQNLARTKGERIVELDGEAFFEVAKNKKRPFVVRTGGMSIEVLGTKFNVNGYSTEGDMTTTLVEGSVEVTNSKNTNDKLLLRPNDQAKLSEVAKSIKKKVVDTEIYTAWMKDKLVVNNLSFKEIMLRLERTYNVDINIDTEHLEGHTYKGEFENGDIATVLSTIALSTEFNYKINANEITITK